MKKETRFETHHVTSDKQGKFVSFSAAIMAMQSVQLLSALSGYLTTSYICLEVRSIELTVHFTEKPYPTLPQGYKYTWRDTTSHVTWDESSHTQKRIRCVVYHFEY